MDSFNQRPHTISLPRIRVLSLGNCGVGKSCLIKRYCEQRFVQRYLPTIGIDYGSTTVDVDGRKVSVHFFDTSGCPLFEEVRTEFYPDMQGVMLVYDVTDRASFMSLDHWMAELRHNLGQSGLDRIVLVVVGTRSDTGGSPNGRQVSEAEGRDWAVRHGAQHVVTSAALGTGVTLAFSTLFSSALKMKERYGPAFSSSFSNSKTSSTNSNFSFNNSGSKTYTSTPRSTNNNSTTSNSTYSSARNNTFSNNSKSNSGTYNNSSSNSTGTTKANTSSASNVSGNASSSSNAGTKPASNNTSSNSGSSDSEAEAVAAINRLLHSTDNLQKLQLTRRGLTKEEVNKAYRRLAALVHPDKCKATGAEEAFKMLAQARNAVLALLTETTV